MTTRSAQWHQGYNPVTHTGAVAAPEEKHKGVKIIPKPATLSGNLKGAACMPLDIPGSPHGHTSISSPKSPLVGLSARIDHLTGVACIPQPSSSNSSSQPNSPTAHSPKSKLLNLRAAVDHMSGPACTVRQVQEVATTEEPAARIERGMTTKLSKDRMLALAAKEHMHSSTLYSVGQGYTKVSNSLEELRRRNLQECSRMNSMAQSNTGD